MTPTSPHPFVLRTWNLLAREYTHYNQAAHGNGPAHGPPEARREAAWQTKDRYLLASAALLTCSADVVCLQECSVSFLDPAHNAMAGVLKEAYSVFEARDASASPGAVVLLKKKHGRLTLAPGLAPQVIAGARFGGASKTACAVPVVRAGQPEPLWIVSGHFAFNAAERSEHLAAIADAVGAAPVILAGDFNAKAPALAAVDVPWFQGLTRVPCTDPTGLTGDLSTPVPIDHVYWRGLPGLTPQAFTEKVPTAPWRQATARGGRGTVIGASDHVWLDVAFQPAG